MRKYYFLSRTYAVRLKIAAKKTGLKDKMLEEHCTTYLRNGCLPKIREVINNCLPNTSFDTMMQHATNYEQNNLNCYSSNKIGNVYIGRKSTKNKADELDV